MLASKQVDADTLGRFVEWLELEFSLAGAERAAQLLDRLDPNAFVRAFRSDLVPQHPNDEPAETALSPIRERITAQPKARPRANA